MFTSVDGESFSTGAEITVVADAASVGSDAGSIRHDGTLIDAPVLSTSFGCLLKHVGEGTVHLLHPQVNGCRLCGTVVRTTP